MSSALLRPTRLFMDSACLKSASSLLKGLMSFFVRSPSDVPCLLRFLEVGTFSSITWSCGMARKSTSDLDQPEQSSSESVSPLGTPAPGKLILSYAFRGDLVDGALFYEDESGRDELAALNGVTFPQMLARLAHHLEMRECGVWLERPDRPGTRTVRLDDGTVELLRTDPVLAIRSMTVEPIEVDRSKVKKAGWGSPFRVGHDALAASFGSSVYCRRRIDLLECPGCGAWLEVRAGAVQCLSKACAARISAKEAGDRWWEVSVEDVLAIDRERYFLPRPWNEPGPWIKHEDLESKYKEWLLLKEEVLHDC